MSCRHGAITFRHPLACPTQREGPEKATTLLVVITLYGATHSRGSRTIPLHSTASDSSSGGTCAHGVPGVRLELGVLWRSTTLEQQHELWRAPHPDGSVSQKLWAWPCIVRGGKSDMSVPWQSKALRQEGGSEGPAAPSLAATRLCVDVWMCACRWSVGIFCAPSLCSRVTAHVGTGL